MAEAADFQEEIQTEPVDQTESRAEEEEQNRLCTYQEDEDMEMAIEASLNMAPVHNP